MMDDVLCYCNTNLDDFNSYECIWKRYIKSKAIYQRHLVCMCAQIYTHTKGNAVCSLMFLTATELAIPQILSVKKQHNFHSSALPHMSLALFCAQTPTDVEGCKIPVLGYGIVEWAVYRQLFTGRTELAPLLWPVFAIMIKSRKSKEHIAWGCQAGLGNWPEGWGRGFSIAGLFF